MDCRRASEADCVSDCGEGVQWPNERKPIFFMQEKSSLSGKRKKSALQSYQSPSTLSGKGKYDVPRAMWSAAPVDMARDEPLPGAALGFHRKLHGRSAHFLQTSTRPMCP